ncbi:ubiquinone anaerobic biosynthesis accessory factor UbiT [Micavibrio aeruginosavorus]|nr:SCP2 sterol-binding domain-containing protein [Micavibrio aeruginosavorus]
MMRIIPIPLVNNTLMRLVNFISASEPRLFQRLEGHHHKWFVIDATNLPFIICLRPDPKSPRLKASRNRDCPNAACRISGSFLTLLGMIDGRYDGDALFFSRDIYIEGDTEAVVCLRNALDDIDGNIADYVAHFFGKPGKKILNIARKVTPHAHPT